MSHASSHVIIQDPKDQYSTTTNPRSSVRSRSGSQVLQSEASDRVSSIPRNFHAPKRDFSDGLRSSSASRKTSHRRTASSSLNLETNNNPAHFRRASSDVGSAPPIYEQPPTPPAFMEPTLHPAPSGRLRTFYDKNRGLAYVLVAQVFGCLMNVTTRLLEIEGNHGAGMHPFQILFVRMAITTTLSTAYMWWVGVPYFPFGMPEVRWLLALRGIGGFFGVFGMYYSLLYLPLADATVITFISPSISCFACSILIKEPFTRMEQVGALISFVGVTLIARPTTFFHHGAVDAPPEDAEASHSHSDYNRVTSSQRFSAVCVALVGVLGQAMAFTTMRWMGKRAHPLLSVNYFCAMCTLVSALAMATLPGIPFLLPQGLKEWAYLFFLGICGFAMQFLLSAGLQIEKSSRATNMVYTQMLFALLFDKLVFGTDPSALSVIGSSLILGSAIYVAMAKESMKARLEEEKLQEEGAINSGQMMEMRRPSTQRPDEERGLVNGMDQEDEMHINGNGKMKVTS